MQRGRADGQRDADSPSDAAAAVFKELEGIREEWIFPENANLFALPATPLDASRMAYGPDSETGWLVMSYLFEGLRAMQAAEREQSGYLGCLSRRGPVWRDVADAGELDRLLIRAYLNDVPAHLLSPQLVAAMPETADGWLLASSEILSELLAALPEGSGSPHHMLETVLPDSSRAPLKFELGDFSFVVGPPEATRSGQRAASVLFKTPFGLTHLSAQIGFTDRNSQAKSSERQSTGQAEQDPIEAEMERLRGQIKYLAVSLERPPFGYAGSDAAAEATIQKLEVEIERALGLALAERWRVLR